MGHAKSYSGFQQILKFKHLLGADVECCNFLFESLTRSVFLSSPGTKERSAYAPTVGKTYNAAWFDFRLRTMGVALHLLQF